MGGARRRRGRKVGEWRRQQLIASNGEEKGSPHQQDGGDGDSRVGERTTTSSIPDLPRVHSVTGLKFRRFKEYEFCLCNAVHSAQSCGELRTRGSMLLRVDVLFRIHSLMPMREAARAACVSRAFLHSWRRHPDLVFNKDTVGLKRSARGENFHRKIDRILRNYLGISLRKFELDDIGMCGFNATSYLDGWLHIALRPGIEELTLMLPDTKTKYSFPCSLLSDSVRNSLRYLKLHFCDLHPTVGLGPLGSLTSLHLLFLSITWDELEHILSNSLALEELDLTHCEQITCLKLPCALQRLSSLSVLGCSSLKVIESKAPNLSSCFLRGHRLDFSLVETLQMKKVDMDRAYVIGDARAKLPSIMPNLETLVIGLRLEVVDAPMLPTKFLYLKHLNISVTSGFENSPWSYDYFSLAFQLRMLKESIFEDSQQRHMMRERHHSKLKVLEIQRFSSAKSLVELTCYILENAVSLERLTLDTTQGSRCDQSNFKRCFPKKSDGALMEAPRALSSIRSYIKYRVPSTVELSVVEPCSQCLARGELLLSSQPCNAIHMYGCGSMYKEMKKPEQL